MAEIERSIIQNTPGLATLLGPDGPSSAIATSSLLLRAVRTSRRAFLSCEYLMGIIFMFSFIKNPIMTHPENVLVGTIQDSFLFGNASRNIGNDIKLNSCQPIHRQFSSEGLFPTIETVLVLIDRLMTRNNKSPIASATDNCSCFMFARNSVFHVFGIRENLCLFQSSCRLVLILKTIARQ